MVSHLSSLFSYFLLLKRINSIKQSQINIAIEHTNLTLFPSSSLIFVPTILAPNPLTKESIQNAHKTIGDLCICIILCMCSPHVPLKNSMCMCIAFTFHSFHHIRVLIIPTIKTTLPSSIIIHPSDLQRWASWCCRLLLVCFFHLPAN